MRSDQPHIHGETECKIWCHGDFHNEYEASEKFCLDMMDHVPKSGIDSTDTDWVVKHFYQANPQWGGNIGRQFAEDLIDFEKYRPDLPAKQLS